MLQLTSRKKRHSAERGMHLFGAPVRRRSARLLVAGGAVMLVASFSSTAWANAPEPSNMPAQTDTVIANANGTVTVTATGSWVWAFSSTPKTNQGIDVTASAPCDDRFGAGWAVAWSDPSDPGYTETFHNDNGTATVNLGSKGVIASNTEDHVLYSKTDPCGTFEL